MLSRYLSMICRIFNMTNCTFKPGNGGRLISCYKCSREMSLHKKSTFKRPLSFSYIFCSNHFFLTFASPCNFEQYTKGFFIFFRSYDVRLPTLFGKKTYFLQSVSKPKSWVWFRVPSWLTFFCFHYFPWFRFFLGHHIYLFAEVQPQYHTFHRSKAYI